MIKEEIQFKLLILVQG